MGIQVAGGIFLKYGSSILKINSKYVRLGHKLSGLVGILISFGVVLLVTQEAMPYFWTVALPSTLLVGTSVFKFKKLKSKSDERIINES